MVDIVGNYGKVKRWVKAQLHTNHQSASSESASFKDVNIALNEAYKQGADIILRIKDLNTFVGIDAGKITTGVKNTFMGYTAGYLNTSGYNNTFMGYRAGYSNTNGRNNNFMGYQAGHLNTIGYNDNFIGANAGRANTSGDRNNFIGSRAGYNNNTGHHNNFMGYGAGYNNTTGYYNNSIGYYAGRSNIAGYHNNCMGTRAGYNNVNGHHNNFLGANAGFYETGNQKLFIDNDTRASEADARIKALIYGIFDAATANQLIRLNGILELTSIKSGSTQANAGAGANEVWKTASHASLPDNVLMIGV